MENKKTKIISIVAIVALALTLITATFAYFQAQTGEGSQTDIKINASTVDTFTFETGSAISLTMDQESFASGKGNAMGSTFAKAILTANNKTNTATDNYNLFLNISDNNFKYTDSATYPELLLTIKDGSNNEITSISGLEYKTVTDGKGTTVKGFDITTKTGLITLLSNRSITTTSSKTDTWNITITFVNYDKDQSANAGKSFSGQVLISKDSFENYTPNTINTLSATKSGSNLTVNLNVEQGSNEIDKYYYAIEEKSAIAYTNTTNIKRLASTLSSSSINYIESTSSSYTFTNIDSTKNYNVYAYAIDKKKIKSNTYEYNVYSGTYVYPTINKVETSTTSSSITATVTATKGTNNISKYYYSIDGGNTFVESNSNSYTFANLNKETNYIIITKVMDSNGKASNVFVNTTHTLAAMTLSNYVISQYNNIQGNNGLYYHNSSLANGAGDNSYRYAGANPNNYVCFGSDAKTCPEDNLYRIIGVFDNKVKLIKSTVATSNLLGTNGGYSTDTTYKWSDLYSCPSDTTAYIQSNNLLMVANKNILAAPFVPSPEGCNKWQYSELNNINLNTNFINNIGSVWSNMIEDTTWKISANVDTAEHTPSEFYGKEEVDSSVNKTKVGLIYASDYGFAASPSAWTLNLTNYNNTVATSNNWIFINVNEWVLPSSNSGYVFYLSNAGLLSYGNANSVFSTRPTLYLKASVKYAGGLGTKDSPIILEV